MLLELITSLVCSQMARTWCDHSSLGRWKGREGGAHPSCEEVGRCEREERYSARFVFVSSSNASRLDVDQLRLSFSSVMIVSYETLRSLGDELKGCEVGLLLADEGHRLKNAGELEL